MSLILLTNKMLGYDIVLRRETCTGYTCNHSTRILVNRIEIMYLQCSVLLHCIACLNLKSLTLLENTIIYRIHDSNLKNDNSLCPRTFSYPS